MEFPASWCQLKCLTLDAYYRAGHGGVQQLAQELCLEFAQVRQPLPNSVVTLSRSEAPQKDVMLPAGGGNESGRTDPEHPECGSLLLPSPSGACFFRSSLAGSVSPSPHELKASSSARRSSAVLANRLRASRGLAPNRGRHLL